MLAMLMRLKLIELHLASSTITEILIAKYAKYANYASYVTMKRRWLRLLLLCLASFTISEKHIEKC